MRITLNQIEKSSLFPSGWETLLKSLNKKCADDTEVSIAHLLNSNGIIDTLWVINNCIADREEDKRNMYADFAESAIEHAERVLHIFEKERPNDNRPREAIEKAKECVKLARIDVSDVSDARRFAWIAAMAADAAANDASSAARAACTAACAAARITESAAARITESAAATNATWAADAAACAAAWNTNAATNDIADTAMSATTEKMEIEKQKRIILKYFG